MQCAKVQMFHIQAVSARIGGCVQRGFTVQKTSLHLLTAGFLPLTAARTVSTLPIWALFLRSNLIPKLRLLPKTAKSSSAHIRSPRLRTPTKLQSLRLLRSLIFGCHINITAERATARTAKWSPAILCCIKTSTVTAKCSVRLHFRIGDRPPAAD